MGRWRREMDPGSGKSACGPSLKLGKDPTRTCGHIGVRRGGKRKKRGGRGKFAKTNGIKRKDKQRRGAKNLKKRALLSPKGANGKCV